MVYQFAASLRGVCCSLKGAGKSHTVQVLPISRCQDRCIYSAETTVGIVGRLVRCFAICISVVDRIATAVYFDLELPGGIAV